MTHIHPHSHPHPHPHPHSHSHSHPQFCQSLFGLALILFVFLFGLMELRAGPGAGERAMRGQVVSVVQGLPAVQSLPVVQDAPTSQGVQGATSLQDAPAVPEASNQHNPSSDSVAARFFDQVDRLQRLTLLHHPELRALESKTEAARAGIDAAGTFREPELRIRKDLNPMGDGSGLSTFAVSVVQPLPWFGSYQTEKEKQAGVVAVEEQMREGVLLERLEEVALVWLEITNLMHQKTMLRESLERLEELIRLSEVRYEAGRQSRADLLRLEMERETAEQQIVTLERAYESLMATLMQLTGTLGERPQTGTTQMADTQTGDTQTGAAQNFPAPMAHELPEPNFAALLTGDTNASFSTESLMARIRPHHPELQVPRLQRDVLAAESRRVQLQSLPSFGVGVELMGRNAGVMGMFPDSGEQWAGMISLRVPVYRTEWRAKQEQIRLQSRSLEFEEQQRENELWERVSQLLTEWERRRADRLFYAEELLPRLDETVAILKEEYRSDRVAIDEILALERERFRYLHEQQEAVIDQYRVLFRLRSLLAERVVGSDRFVKPSNIKHNNAN